MLSQELYTTMTSVFGGHFLFSGAVDSNIVFHKLFWNNAKMSGFGHGYIPITQENVLTIPPELGIRIGSTVIRPFGFRRNGTNHEMLVVRGSEHHPSLVQTNDYLGTIPGLYETPARRSTPIIDSVVRTSFRYYKQGSNGLETAYRNVAFVPGEVSIAYGVHPDHSGEAPTWYLRGYHTGFSYLDEEGQLLPGDEIANPQIKNFSIARVVGGPLGDPLTNAAFRQRMNIPEIPQS